MLSNIRIFSWSRMFSTGCLAHIVFSFLLVINKHPTLYICTNFINNLVYNKEMKFIVDL